MEQGMIHIYCGDGKGKTTAAIGLAARAAGCGMKVLFARFLKNEDSGELKVLDSVPEIEVLHLVRSYGFFNTLTEEEKEEVRQMYGELWERIKKRISCGEFRHKACFLNRFLFRKILTQTAKGSRVNLLQLYYNVF